MITLVRATAMIPLNTARVAKKRVLIETFKRSLTSILALLERENVKAEDSMVRVRPLLKECHAKEDIRCKTHSEQVAAEAAHVDALSSTIYHGNRVFKCFKKSVTRRHLQLLPLKLKLRKLKLKLRKPIKP